MKAIRFDGVVQTLRAGEAICGTGFSSITITHDDMKDLRGSVASTKMFFNWLEHLLTCRMMKPSHGTVSDTTKLFLHLVERLSCCGVHIVPCRETKENCTEPAYKGTFPRYGYNVKVDGAPCQTYVFYRMDDVKWVLGCAIRQLEGCCAPVVLPFCATKEQAIEAGRMVRARPFSIFTPTHRQAWQRCHRESLWQGDGVENGEAHLQNYQSRTPMKASEHIVVLQALIAKHGDLPMRIHNDEWQCSDEMRSVTHQQPQAARGQEHTRSHIPAEPECFVVN